MQDIYFLIELAFALVFIAFVLREYLIFKKGIAITKARAEGQGSRKLDVAGALEQAQFAYDEAIKTREEMIKHGATAEALKPFDDKVKKLKFVVDNRYWIEPFAPYIDDLAKIALRWLK